MDRYVIIGSGAAGIAAAEAIRRQDTVGEIVLISEDRGGYYSRPGLAYYLTGEIPERALYPFGAQDFKALNVQRIHTRVTKIHPDTYQVALADGRMLSYDRLLIASGSTAVHPDLPGADLDGVVKLDNLDDAQRILKRCRKGRRAVVVGGGITALEIVEGLRAQGVQCTYFLRGDRYWSNVLDETESRIIEKRLADEGIHICYHTEIAEIVGQDGRVTAVRTRDGRQIACNLVAVAIGVRARIELAQVSGLCTDRGIRVDETMRTSHADIFAAGDAAEVYDPFTQRYSLNTLWGPARNQGTVAGTNMAGGGAVYRNDIPFNVTRLAGLTTTIIGTVGSGEDDDLVGIARGDSETWRQLPEAIAAENRFEVNRLRLLVGEQTLLGAVVMGDQTLSQPLLDLVAGQADIQQIRHKLLQPGARLGDVVVDFWQTWSQNHAGASSGSAQQR